MVFSAVASYPYKSIFLGLTRETNELMEAGFQKQ